ncbi:hypothetical protein DRQ50_02945 [bacterium]|nr:MAG: hypothetical protein DRQ50_02945 [bacterium]
MARKKSHDGLLKDGTSRLAKTGGRRGISPIMWVAVAACAAGAFFLFRGQGGGGGSGIGEQRSVVTMSTDSTAIVGTGSPRSGDVEISGEVQELTPERPAAQTEVPKPAPEAAKQEPEAKAPVKKTTKPATTAKPATTSKPPAETVKIQTSPRGGWIVQTGSFGTMTNAEKEAGRLRKAGLDARVKMANLADGSIAYRVRISYFASRDEARAFAKQEKKLIPGAIAVHR